MYPTREVPARALIANLRMDPYEKASETNNEEARLPNRQPGFLLVDETGATGVDRLHHPQLVRFNSTRRFSALPSAVALSAIGCVIP